MNKSEKTIVKKVEDIKAVSNNPLPDVQKSAELIKRRTC